jgi:ornithine cyclodeaminase/alanine dehydrogenase-like protein (mu-crystallin family)
MERQTGDRILYLGRNEVAAICGEMDPVALVQEVFCAHGAGNTILPDEAYLGWRNGRDDAVRSLNMPGYLGGKFCAAGTKIINSNPANTARGLPRASGLTLLFDPETARILCIMEASYISAVRTAAVSMFALRVLACPGPRTLCVIGAGVIGTTHLELAIRTFPTINRAILFDVDAARAGSARDSLKQGITRQIEIEVAANPEDAVRPADAVVAATTVTNGYIPYSWLKPGCVALNVSLDDFLPEVFLKADLLFVDDWNLVSTDRRRLLGRLHQEGKIAGPHQVSAPANARRVDGELGDLALGRRPGRGGVDQIILVNPFGLAIEDVAFASRIFDIAQRRELGTYISV